MQKILRPHRRRSILPEATLLVLVLLLASTVVLAILVFLDISEAGNVRVPSGTSTQQPTSAVLAAGLLHSALINYDRQLYIWGDNSNGQLGLGEEDYYDTPQLLTLPGPVISISLGDYHSLAVLEDGTVWAWGRNAYGQLGTGSTENSSLPVQVTGLPLITRAAAGAYHSLALGADGSVWAWGNDSNLQVGSAGSETITDSSGNKIGSRCLSPYQVLAGGAVAIAAGNAHSLYLNESGQVYAWGDNSRGQLGDGSTQSHAQPMLILGLDGVWAIAAGYQHNLVLCRHDGLDSLLAWGDDSLGQLGIGSDPSANSYRTLPVRVDLTGDEDPANDQAAGIFAGYAQSAALVPAVDPQGTAIPGRQKLLVWGSNSAGQLALGDASSQNQPVAISGTFNGWTGDSFLPFDSAAFGGYHLLVLSSKGLLAAAGSGARGQLGNLSVLERRTMVPVSIPDVIRPAWLAESSLNTVLDSDGELTVRWPAAQDNREVAGYRIRLRRSDGQIEEQDAGDQLTWTFSALSAELAYEIQVWAYDSDSVKASPTQLSNLVTYILPEKAGRDAKVADYFSVWEKSVWQIDNLPHNWHLDPQGLLRPLEVPWDVSSIYAEAALPQTDNWHGLRLSAWGAALLLAAALLLMLRQRSVRRQALIRFTAVLPMNAGR